LFDFGEKMIDYVTSLDGITSDMLTDFFVGWPNPPSATTHLSILRGSCFVVLAIDREANRVVGFINAVSDGILSAYIPLLEVLPDHQSHGIGTELVKRMLDLCAGLYMVDTTCDPALQRFYARCGMQASTGAMIRNYAKQPGKVDRDRDTLR
jgi:GNAT superfamily N-acetyltransferase